MNPEPSPEQAREASTIVEVTRDRSTVSKDELSRDEPAQKALATSPSDRRRGRRGARLCWAYARAILSVLALLRFAGTWWPIHLLPFLAPGLVLGLPALPLALAIFWTRRWDLLGLWTATLGVIAGPILGLVVPWQRLTIPPPEDAPRIRMMTWNRGPSPIDPTALLKFIDREDLDLICFQEGVETEALEQALFDRGWSVHPGRLIFSRFPIVEAFPAPNSRQFGYQIGTGQVHRLVVRLEDGTPLVVASCHTVSVRKALWALRGGEFQRVEDLLQTQRSNFRNAVLRLFHEIGDRPLLIGGDFNLPPQNPLLISMRERTRNAFAQAGWGFGATWPASSPWVRIDHIWASRHWQVIRSWVGPDLGSDHRPVLAEFRLVRRPIEPFDTWVSTKRRDGRSSRSRSNKRGHERSNKIGPRSADRSASRRLNHPLGRRPLTQYVGRQEDPGSQDADRP